MCDSRAKYRLICGQCGREKEVSLAWMRQKRLLDENMKGVKVNVARLVCSACGAKKAKMCVFTAAPLFTTSQAYSKKKTKTYKNKMKKSRARTSSTRLSERDEKIAAKQRNKELLKRQNNYRQQVSAKYRSKGDIFVEHSGDD